MRTLHLCEQASMFHDQSQTVDGSGSAPVAPSHLAQPGEIIVLRLPTVRRRRVNNVEHFASQWTRPAQDRAGDGIRPVPRRAAGERGQGDPLPAFPPPSSPPLPPCAGKAQLRSGAL